MSNSVLETLSTTLDPGHKDAIEQNTEASFGSGSPHIAIVVPTLNEEEYIAGCLHSLIGQWPAATCEILVLDGGSTDRTQEIVADFARQHSIVRLITNERRLQSAAMNLAARLASPRAAVLVRADAHAVYPRDFVRSCVVELLRTGATSVVVPMQNMARSGAGLQRAVAAAQSSRLGNGGSPHRIGRLSGLVEHGHHAVFDRHFFMAIGGYDESFTHNEDAEFDHRALQAGGRIWMHVDAPVSYYPRDSLIALAKQYLRHGRGRGRTLRKHKLRPKPRQLAPIAVLLGCVFAVISAPLEPTFGLLSLVYPLACSGWGAALALRQRDAWLSAAGPALIIMHLAWGVGFLQSVFRGRPTLTVQQPPLRLLETDATQRSLIQPNPLSSYKVSSSGK